MGEARSLQLRLILTLKKESGDQAGEYKSFSIPARPRAKFANWRVCSQFDEMNSSRELVYMHICSCHMSQKVLFKQPFVISGLVLAKFTIDWRKIGKRVYFETLRVYIPIAVYCLLCVLCYRAILHTIPKRHFDISLFVWFFIVITVCVSDRALHLRSLCKSWFRFENNVWSWQRNSFVVNVFVTCLFALQERLRAPFWHK